MRARAPLLMPILLLCVLAMPAVAAPALFQASFIFHGWGNDTSSGNPSTAPSQYTTNDWTAAPLGYDCQDARSTTNGVPNPQWCSPAKRQRGHPADGSWSRSLGMGTPRSIEMRQSDFGVALEVKTPSNTWGVAGCCRGFRLEWTGLQSFTYATFVNAAGSFFAGGGAAAGAGYNNKLPATPMTAGSWLIRAGKNVFGGAMALLGKYGATGKYTVPAQGGATYHGVSSWNMVKALGRPLFNTAIGSTASGAPLYQNPYTKTDKWYRTMKGGKVKTIGITAIGSGTLWTTGQVGGFAKTGAYFTTLWRTGYDNRTAGGLGNIQLVTPTLTHWLGPGLDTHTAQIGILKIQVPEPGAVLLLTAGAGALIGLRRASRRR